TGPPEVLEEWAERVWALFAQALKLLEVAANREVPPGAANDDDVHLLGELRQRLGQLPTEFNGDRIHHLRAVEQDVPHRPFHPGPYRLGRLGSRIGPGLIGLAHISLPPPTSNTAPVM